MGIIRLMLALSVVAAHTNAIFGLSLVGGQLAVKAFYIISGFYMTLILNEKYVGKFDSYKLFISNRFLRIYPIFWTVLGLIVCFSLFQFVTSHGNGFGEFYAYANYIKEYGSGAMGVWAWMVLICSNLLLFGQDIIMFLGINPATGHLFFTSNFQLTNPQLYTFLLAPQAWTLGIELLFYVVAPFIVRRKTWVIIFVIFLSTGLRFYLYSRGLNQDPWTYRFFPLELTFFLLGTLSYKAYARIKDNNLDKRLLWAALGVMVGMTVLYPLATFPHKDVAYCTVFFLILPLVFILTKKSSWDSRVGELSYPVYIVHLLVAAAVSYFSYPQVYRGVIVATGSIMLAILLNKFVAAPIERIRQARVRTG